MICVQTTRLFNNFLLKQATVFTYESSKTNEFSMILAKTPAEIEQSPVHTNSVRLRAIYFYFDLYLLTAFLSYAASFLQAHLLAC